MLYIYQTNDFIKDITSVIAVDLDALILEDIYVLTVIGAN